MINVSYRFLAGKSATRILIRVSQKKRQEKKKTGWQKIYKEEKQAQQTISTKKSNYGTEKKIYGKTKLMQEVKYYF